MITRVGVIGLGLMGKPMARNLLRSGFSVTVFNRSQPAIDELAAEGAIAAQSPRELASGCEVVITMLPDGPDVEAVLQGESGVLAGALPGTILIDMSTISPKVATDLAAQAESRGIAMLDAPVSGGDVGAQNATLSIMVGGDPAAFERARPVFEALGKTITYCGPGGSGQIVKACNQLVVAIMIEAVSEAFVFGGKLGVDPQTILTVLSGGLAQNRVMDLRGPTMIAHQFAPGGKAKFHSKDLRIILEMARENHIALPATATVDMLFNALLAADGGDLDHSALITVIEKLSAFSL
jgi:2-hydroxy-3-oxopropionate reductase